MNEINNDCQKLEDFLVNGEIILGKIREYIIAGVFVFHDPKKDIIRVQSERGVKHVLTLLWSELVRITDLEYSTQILYAADNTYIYGMNRFNIKALDDMVLKSFLRVCIRKNKVCIECRSADVPTGKEFPGPYYKEALEETIEKALDLLMQKDFAWIKPSFSTSL